MKLYDEKEAVAYIRHHLAEEISDDVIINVIDAIFDYYEDNGDLDLDFDDELNDDDDSADDVESIVTYILNGDYDVALSRDDIVHIVAAELSYEQSLLE